jgi:hypothetical protein
MPRGANEWQKALKIWNGNKGAWCIPKKGSIGYNEVREIMKGGVQTRSMTKVKSMVENIEKTSKQMVKPREDRVVRKRK